MNLSILYHSLFSFIQKSEFGFRHLLDFFVIFVLLFMLLTLLKKTRATAIAMGVLLLGSVYGLSLVLDLPLTKTVFNYLFGTLLIVLAVVFQRELRRFFEYLGFMGMKNRTQPPTDGSIKIITQAVEQMAKNKTGALIIFPGKENIERHTEGGVRLNGLISSQLILSIFDSTSPGHDGAVIIDKDKIKKFSVHLPLAENIEAVRGFGTRHRAALGLTEVTDALCLVVSEERGIISIAHNKKIFAIKDAAELEKVLRSFIEEISPLININAHKKWLAKNSKTLGVSFLVASIVWLVFTYQTSVVQRKFTVPVEFKDVPPGYVVEDYTPEEFIISLSGQESDFNLLNPNTLKVSLGLSQMKAGWRQIVIKKEDISYPGAFSLVKIDPERISLLISKASK